MFIYKFDKYIEKFFNKIFKALKKIKNKVIRIIKKIKNKFKSYSLYKKTLIVYSLILFIISITCLVHVYNSLVLYDEYELDNFMTNFANEMRDAITHNNFSLYNLPTTIKSPYESETSLAYGMSTVIGNKKLTYEETDKENVYAINVGDKTLFYVELDASKKETRLSLLTITKYKVKNIKVESEEGVYHADIYAPSNYKVLINKIDIRQEDIKEKTQLEGFEDAYNYTQIPTINHYKITNLTNKPLIEIYDENNNLVEIEEQDDTYNIKEENIESEEMLNGFNPLTVAETWSLYLTNDTSFQNISNYLIPNSTMYNKASAWNKGIDKTFTASHILATQPFTNESIENLKIYSSSAFKVDVKLDKNLILTKNNQKKVITMHETLYFVKYNGEYKLVNMVSL